MIFTVAATAPDFAGVSALDAFLMLRTGIASDGMTMGPGRKRARVLSDCGDYRAENKKLGVTLVMYAIENSTLTSIHFSLLSL